jgi:hypothetical protein
MRVFDMHLYKYDIDVFTNPPSCEYEVCVLSVCVLAVSLAASETDPQSGDAGRAFLVNAPAKCSAT